MKLCKVHLPDCSKAISFVKKYGGHAGTWLGKGIMIGVVWACMAIAVAIAFVAMFAVKALLGICSAFVDVMKIAGRFIKGGIDGLSDGDNDSRQSESSDSDFGKLFWRRSA